MTPFASPSTLPVGAPLTVELEPGENSWTLDVYNIGNEDVPSAVRTLDGLTAGGSVVVDTHAFPLGQVKLVLRKPGADHSPSQLITVTAASVDVRGSIQPDLTYDALWSAIRSAAESRRFDKYERFVKCLLCGQEQGDGCGDGTAKYARRCPCLGGGDCCLLPHGTQSYERLKCATQLFLKCETSAETSFLDLGEQVNLGVEPSYLRQILGNLGLERHKFSTTLFCDDSLRHVCPVELFWSYWCEQSGLVQAITALALRFQNRLPLGKSILQNFSIDPLRPLGNFLWAYGEDCRRLTPRRRAYEYAHEYGVSLHGAAVGKIQPAESRTQFIPAFNELLNQAATFYKEDANSLVNPDPFPILNSLRAAHLLLAAGAGNQFGDLPLRAREEMLIQQWLLSRSPVREFLHSRATIPYKEPWMGQVDALHKHLGWVDVSSMEFHRLAEFGEVLLLSMRYLNWSIINDPHMARDWTLFFRPEIQGYIQAYRAVTGVDLSTRNASGRVDATPPSILLRRRLAETSAAKPRVQVAG